MFIKLGPYTYGAHIYLQTSQWLWYQEHLFKALLIIIISLQ